MTVVCALAITGFYLTCGALKLRFDASSTAAMPTLPHLVRKREKANTKDAAIEKARAIMVRKAPAKKKTAKRPGGLTMATNGSRVVSEDELDARLIREARRSDRSKVRYSVNELREQRGLAAI
jgi:hypothetical protein